MDEESFASEFRGYAIGLVLALLLSAVPFVCVGWHVLSRGGLLWLIGAAALVQIVVHFRQFLQINLSRSKRDDLQLILFSTLIAILMVGGTIWIFYNQQMRMM